MARIDPRGALDTLPSERLYEIAARFQLDSSASQDKSALVHLLTSSHHVPFRRILEVLRSDELRAICRATGIDDSGREQAVIADRILRRSPVVDVETFTKADLIDDVAAATNLLTQDVERIVSAVLATMTEALKAGESLELRGFGSFRFRERAARVGRNPKTGASVSVPPTRVCYFRPGKALLEIVNS